MGQILNACWGYATSPIDLTHAVRSILTAKYDDDDDNNDDDHHDDDEVDEASVFFVLFSHETTSHTRHWSLASGASHPR